MDAGGLDFGYVIGEAMAASLGESPPRSKTRVWFEMNIELNERKTEEEGRPIFNEYEVICFRMPGRPVEKYRCTKEHRQQYVREYNHFIDLGKEVAEGTPIDTWVLITRQKAEELKYSNIRTIEQLAAWDLHERPLNPESAAYVSMAIDYLAKQDAKDKRIAELEDEIAALKKRSSGRQRKGDQVHELVNDMSECG